LDYQFEISIDNLLLSSNLCRSSDNEGGTRQEDGFQKAVAVFQTIHSDTLQVHHLCRRTSSRIIIILFDDAHDGAISLASLPLQLNSILQLIQMSTL